MHIGRCIAPPLIRCSVFGMLLSAACSGATRETAFSPDAGATRASDAATDSAQPIDAATSVCPRLEPTPGAACAGELRCQLASHGDCKAPGCPPGCKYLGIAPGATLTSGVTFFAVCQDGQWTRASEGDCSTNQAAALCDCPDHDAGT
jgi:hypothetical protein